MTPTKGRIVHFRAEDGEDYAGMVVGGPYGLAENGEAYVDLVTFGTHSMYFHNQVPYDEACGRKTWHWPPREP